jgi:hypothetical protein
MANSNESGNAKNVANFESLTNAANGYGQAYNPSKQLIILTALLTLLGIAQNAISLVNSVSGNDTIVIKASTVAFKPLSKLPTCIITTP